MTDHSFMIYGAYGYTGELIAREAVARGLQPILAGRDDDRVHALAQELGLESRAFGLKEASEISPQLADVDVLLHCAGPFSATAPQVMAACIQAHTHYLDITGEISVFEHAFSRHDDAVTAGVVLCCGVGFDVVPTDCLAAYLAEAMPDATALALGFDSRSGFSPGTAKTSVEGLAEGGKVRRDGRVTTVPLADSVREIDFGDGPKQAMTIPWGDISTAWRTTGIGNIEVYMPMAPKRITQVKRLNWVRPLLGLAPLQALLKSRAGRVQGPDAGQRESSPTHVWGEVRNAEGEVRVGRLLVANGYTVTLHASLAIVAQLFAGDTAGGAYTPSQLAGRDLAERLPGSGKVTISAE
ncbi:saccharopine dehydrogenase family protein [Salinisphaera aquimarina]|uniref:Saccharopine dehydrogenase family protein n=1 Tax=Salinisphaera aquimarina TaxID=2094031 RepID=A0ABV7EPR3_9GAMM